QAKPEQRRRVLEDAAGVAGLHARRHEAELRLKAAETNLTRVEDVIGQLAGQIDGLKRQARQAIRYREVAAKVRKAEAMLFHLRWVGANADVAEAGHTHDVAVREMAERTREQAAAARIQAERAAELPALRDAEARAARSGNRQCRARRAKARAGDRRPRRPRRALDRDDHGTAEPDAGGSRLAGERSRARRRPCGTRRRPCAAGRGRQARAAAGDR